MKEKVGRPENWGLGLWFAKARTRRRMGLLKRSQSHPGTLVLPAKYQNL